MWQSCQHTERGNVAPIEIAQHVVQRICTSITVAIAPNIETALVVS